MLFEQSQFTIGPRTYHCYHITPIDFWNEAIELSVYLERIKSTPHIEDGETVAKGVLNFLEFAKHHCANYVGWEGDIREGPYVTAIPFAEFLEPVFMWKQDNNGCTFIVSPIPMPWLAE